MTTWFQLRGYGLFRENAELDDGGNPRVSQAWLKWRGDHIETGVLVIYSYLSGEVMLTASPLGNP